MSEQETEVVNPAQAIYDALSDEAKKAVDALPDHFFTDQIGRVVAAFIASSAVEVNSKSSRLWSIQLSTQGDDAESLAFNVAGNNAVFLHRHNLRILVTSEIEDAIDLSSIHATIAKDQTYREHHLAQLLFDMNTVTQSDLEGVKQFHLDAITELVMLGYKINHRWKWHRDDWRVRVALVTNRELPPPAYVPEDRIGLPLERLNPLPGNKQLDKRYWKISAGRGARDWHLFLEESVIALSWYEEAVDPSDYESTKDEFVDRLMEATSVSRPGADSIWTFRNELSIGDEVLVYARGEVLGRGRVVGDYRYDPDAEDYRHRRAVEWIDVEPISTSEASAELQQKLSRQKTLFELTRHEFMSVTGNGDASRNDAKSGNRIADFLSKVLAPLA